MRPVFVTGTGTGIGKTLVSAILVNALEADYWKPIQAGYDEGTDSEFVNTMRSSERSKVYPELYKLKLPASPHIAARQEGIEITTDKIAAALPASPRTLVIEGAGGIMVPISNSEFVVDLISKLNARVILVSRNYLGSINHSLLTASFCKERKLDVTGWIFNDVFGDYENEIANWTGYPVIAKLPKLERITPEIVAYQAGLLNQNLLSSLLNGE